MYHFRARFCRPIGRHCPMCGRHCRCQCSGKATFGLLCCCCVGAFIALATGDSQLATVTTTAVSLLLEGCTGRQPDRTGPRAVRRFVFYCSVWDFLSRYMGRLKLCPFGCCSRRTSQESKPILFVRYLGNLSGRRRIVEKVFLRSGWRWTLRL